MRERGGMESYPLHISVSADKSSEEKDNVERSQAILWRELLRLWIKGGVPLCDLNLLVW